MLVAKNGGCDGNFRESFGGISFRALLGAWKCCAVTVTAVWIKLDAPAVWNIQEKQCHSRWQRYWPHTDNDPKHFCRVKCLAGDSLFVGWVVPLRAPARRRDDVGLHHPGLTVRDGSWPIYNRWSTWWFTYETWRFSSFFLPLKHTRPGTRKAMDVIKAEHLKRLREQEVPEIPMGCEGFNGVNTITINNGICLVWFADGDGISHDFISDLGYNFPRVIHSKEDV